MNYQCKYSCELSKDFGICICECKEECFKSNVNKDTNFQCPFQDGTPHNINKENQNENKK